MSEVGTAVVVGAAWVVDVVVVKAVLDVLDDAASVSSGVAAA